MKQFVFVIAIFAFLASGWANAVHAEALNLLCSPSASQVQVTDNPCADDHSQEKIDFEQCQDCCCHHVHVMTKRVSNISVLPDLKAGYLVNPQEEPASKKHSPLYKPPIA